MKFSALNADFSTPRANHLGSRTPAQVGLKEGYVLKSGYFTGFGLSSVETVKDRPKHIAYHNKQ